MPPRKARQRSLRKTRVASDDEDDQEGSQAQSVAQAADIIAARKQKKKEARKQALLGGNTSGGGYAHGGPVDMMAGRTTDEYTSISKMNAMAKELNVTISGSFRKGDGQVDDGRLSMGFQKRLAGDADTAGTIDEDLLDTQYAGGADDPRIGLEQMEDVIPDEETIRKARQRREMLRKGEPDFIPVKANARTPLEFDPHDADKDDLSFVREQIGKGLRTMAIRPQARQPLENGAAIDLKPLDATKLADEILSKLTVQLERVDMTLKQHDHGIQRTKENLTDTVNKLFEDEKILEDLSSEFEKAQEMREYVRGLCSMLHEKSPILVELQHQSLQSRVERARAVSGAFQTSTKGQLLSASKGVDTAMKVLFGGGGEDDARLAAERAVAEADASLRSGDHIPVELDEFGRDMNMERRIMAQKGTSIQDIASKAHRAFSNRQEEIRLELKNIFADADEQFASLSAVRNRLESWKASFETQYDATFMGLSAPALFAPFVRLELITWDPLLSTSQSFTKHHWYSLLFDYGAQSPESDPDHQVVPSLVTQVVVPWVADLVKDVWDPVNLTGYDGLDELDGHNQCLALSGAVKDIMAHYDSENQANYKPVGALLDAIFDKLKQAVDSLAADTPSWLPTAIAVTERAQECREILFKRGTSLISCVCSLIDVLPSTNIDALVEPLGKTVLQILRSYVASASVCATKAALLCDALVLASGRAGGALRSMLESVSEIVSALPKDERLVATTIERLKFL